ncbi:MAG TPA: sigma-70 family RNA polymerase sigma factor [Candidatus Solibacter sp.]|nr:sigma-70 family RNA polymerase sigma factor [Candidatus Solibacter sp.]
MATSIIELSPERPAETTEADDLQLVNNLRQGAEGAYEELIQRFQQPVYALALRLVGDQGEACDIVQEVFLKVFRYIGDFRGQSSLKTWMYRITFNEAHNSRRWFSRHRRGEVELDSNPEESRNWKETIPDSSRSPFDVACDRERHIMIEAALREIKPVYRDAVVLRDTMDHTYEEIADILGVSLGTVKSRILRGREALREELTNRLNARPAMQLVPKTAE